jgi:hypothetical protein
MNGKRYGINAILCLTAYIYNFGMLALLLTPFFQVSALSFPVVLALTKRWEYILIFPLMALFGGKFLYRWILSKFRVMPVKEYKRFTYKKIFFVAKTLTFYFFRGLLPVAPDIFPNYLRYFGFTGKDTADAYRIDYQTIFGLVLLLGIPVLYITYPTLGLPLLWWLVTISVFSNWITLTVTFADRYMYLPNVGLMVFLGTALNLIHPFAWLIVFGIYVGRLVTYIPIYKNIVSYLEHHTYIDPKNDSAWVSLVELSNSVNEYAIALNYVNTGIKNNGNSPRLWMHKAALLNALNNKKKALECVAVAREKCVDGFEAVFIDKINKIEKMIKEK